MEIDVRELCVERGPDACTQTRDWVSLLSAQLPSRVAADVELLTHELVTNAFRHSDTERAWITMLMLPGSILVQVTDEGDGDPEVRPLSPYSESGRGLHWVSALASVWGIHRGATTGVWFQVDCPKYDLAVSGASV